ncbi:MAG: S-adenosylmethionine:tRNA ribosyltransferase-isomerase [Acidobacteriota bacterium]
MKPARSPRSNTTRIRLLVAREGELQHSAMDHLPEHLEAGDLLVVNDAATMPASLHGRDQNNNEVEIRLTRQLREHVWEAVIFGIGNWEVPTEKRPSPPRLRRGDEVSFAEDFKATVLEASPLSERLLTLEFDLDEPALWRLLYQYGKPIQYSYMQGELDLWSVQNIYGGRPWAAEMPSAGYALKWSLLLKLLRMGVQVVALTHGAGLSSTGDARIDEELPLVEAFEIPLATMDAVARTRARGGRVIAIGTSVVRALESADAGLSGITSLRLGPEYRPKIVDGLLTGTHDVSESHYKLLRAFLPESMLLRLNEQLELAGYLTHEFGDLCLILRSAGDGRH